ncbi:MAG TPA: hypothetical protein VEH04_14095 [Verrucomicrobiae bacterium]|nr:hypothetical protein [Verrucomicrobiae bacterium]
MNPIETDLRSDNPQECSSRANHLDVYRNERLAYTEVPVAAQENPFSARLSALLKGMYHWIQSRH